MIIVNIFGVLCCPMVCMYISRFLDSHARELRRKPISRFRHDAGICSTYLEQASK